MLPLGFLSEFKLPKRAPEQKNQCDRLIESVDLEREILHNPAQTSSYRVALFTHCNERTRLQSSLRVVEYAGSPVRQML